MVNTIRSVNLLKAPTRPQTKCRNFIYNIQLYGLKHYKYPSKFSAYVEEIYGLVINAGEGKKN